MIYSTNWVERLNRCYKRTLLMRGAMPSPASVFIFWALLPRRKQKGRVQDDFRIFGSGRSSKTTKKHQRHKSPSGLGYPKPEGEDEGESCTLFQTFPLDKDMRSPKYVCPTDLRAAHDHYQAKRRAMKERENIIKKRKEAMEAEQAYKELKAKFFGIEFTDGIIRIHVLESVQEHLEEGTAMHHCVYDAHYYSKPQSLIFSATKDGERIETIKVSLETMKVVQSRGVCNKNTEYHEQILALMQKNIRMTAQRATA